MHVLAIYRRRQIKKKKTFFIVSFDFFLFYSLGDFKKNSEQTVNTTMEKLLLYK